MEEVKEKTEEPEIIVMKESVLTLNICTTIPPERMLEIPEKIFALGYTPGTSDGEGRWGLPDLNEYPECKSIECANGGGRWHYQLLC